MKRGYAAIITVIIIGAVFTAVGLTSTLSSISEGQMSLVESQHHRLLGLIDSCSEESLYKINIANTLPSLVVTPNGSCTVTVNSHVGESWDYGLSASVNGIVKSVSLKLNRGTGISISNWQE